MSTFEYEKMTPELQEYLVLSRQHPGYEYPKDEKGNSTGKPTPESDAAVTAWRTKLGALRDRVGQDALSLYFRAKTEWMCRPETQTKEAKETVSPTGRYKLVVTYHGTKPGCWDYTKGRIYDAKGNLITTICRNYSGFLDGWVEDHPNGHDYFLGGEDYQGQTVVELDTGKRVDYLPEAADEGFGFCWIGIHPSPDGLTLAVSGCYWACPSEVVFVDFSHPMDPPWMILDREDEEMVAGWVSNVSCRLGEQRDFVNLPGHPLNGKMEYDLSLEDLRELEEEAKKREVEEDSIWETRMTVHAWERPDDLKVLRKWLLESVSWWSRPNGLDEVPYDSAIQMCLLLQRHYPLANISGLFKDEPEVRKLLLWAAAKAYSTLLDHMRRNSDHWTEEQYNYYTDKMDALNTLDSH
jgi:hypothetical protein